MAELERFHTAYLRVLIPTWIVFIASEILSIWREIQSYHRNLNWQDRLAEQAAREGVSFNLPGFPRFTLALLLAALVFLFL